MAARPRQRELPRFEQFRTTPLSGFDSSMYDSVIA
jgi:hypothetical protein